MMFLSVNNISVSIDKTPILRAAKLEMAAGETVRLAGRNGAGKTTLMRAIMGLATIDDGAIIFNGDHLNKMPASRRARLGIGYMPEDRKLVPEFTVEENILFPAWAMGQRPDNARLRRIYDLMPELSPVLKQRAISLSGGQQKLVALARALNCGTRLLLLDEPFEGIAPALSKRLAKIILTAKTSELAVLIAESDYAHSSQLFDFSVPIERGFIGEKIAHNQDKTKI